MRRVVTTVGLGRMGFLRCVRDGYACIHDMMGLTQLEVTSIEGMNS